MKARVRFGDFGGKVEVQGGEVVIDSAGRRNDFSVFMEELEAPGVKAINVFPRDLDFKIEQEDGWILNIGRGIHEKEHLIVTRFKRPKVGGTLTSEYLTREGKWLPVPPGYGPYPSDIMKIPAPTPEEVPV